MDATLGSLTLLTFCFGVSYWEYARYGTYVTPFGVMAWPYAIVVFMINMGGKYFGFFPVSFISISYMSLCYIFFLLGGKIVVLLFWRKDERIIPVANTAKNIGDLFNFYRPLFIFLAIIAIIAGLIHFYQTVGEVGGLLNIGSQDFDRLYGTGFLSHIQNLSRIVFIFFVSDYLVNKRKYLLPLLVMAFMVIFIRQVKYHVMGLVLGAFYFAILNGIVKFSIKKVILYAFIIFILFNATYYIGFLAVGLDYTFASRTQLRLLNHFFTYLFGGPIAFSEIFLDPKYPFYSLKEIIAPPINIVKFLMQDSDLVDIIIRNWVPVSNNLNMFHTANIFGAIGMLYMYLGFYSTLIYLFLLGILSHLVWIISLRVKHAVGIQLMYSLLMAYLTISFFDLYFNKLVFFEASVYMLVIPPIYLGIKTIINLSNRKRRFSILKSLK